MPTVIEGHVLLTVMPLVDRNMFSQSIDSNRGSKDKACKIAKEKGYDFYVQKQGGIRHAYIEAWPLIRGACDHL
jgi:hypothetical protein